MANPDSLLAALNPVLTSAPEEDLPLLLAMLERLAADRYKNWAKDATDEIERQGLLDCAKREVAIAEFIESLDPNAQARTIALAERFPNANELYDSVMQGCDRAEQFRRQAAGELGGADFLRQFAAATSGAAAAQFEALSCAEQANARFLTRLIA